MEYKQIQENYQNNTLTRKESKSRCSPKGLFFYKNRFFVLNNAYLKNLILGEVHKKPYSGDMGYQKTIIALKKEYFWPKMKTI